MGSESGESRSERLGCESGEWTRERESMELESTKFGSGECFSWECESGE